MSNKSSNESSNGADWLARDMESAADAANAAAPKVDWETLGRIKLEAKVQAKQGLLTVERVNEMVTRAKGAAPKREDVVAELQRDLLALLAG